MKELSSFPSPSADLLSGMFYNPISAFCKPHSLVTVIRNDLFIIEKIRANDYVNDWEFFYLEYTRTNILRGVKSSVINPEKKLSTLIISRLYKQKVFEISIE